MSLQRNDLLALADIAIAAAKQAGAMIQSYAGRNVVIDAKEAGSSPASQIVTEVDYKSQEIVLQYLRPACDRYNLGLLIEEDDDDLSRFAKDYFWCVDPLDGTLPFVEQREGYAVSIALVSSEGDAYLGVVYDPRTQTLYHAIKGAGAYRNRTLWQWQPDFTGSYETIDSGGAVMNACWVLDRAPAGFIKPPKLQLGGGCLWDYAATACLFQELGAVVSDGADNPLNLNSRDSLFMNQVGVVYASHREIAQHLRGAGHSLV